MYHLAVQFPVMTMEHLERGLRLTQDPLDAKIADFVKQIREQRGSDIPLPFPLQNSLSQDNAAIKPEKGVSFFSEENIQIVRKIALKLSDELPLARNSEQHILDPQWTEFYQNLNRGQRGTISRAISLTMSKIIWLDRTPGSRKPESEAGVDSDLIPKQLHVSDLRELLPLVQCSRIPALPSIVFIARSFAPESTKTQTV